MLKFPWPPWFRFVVVIHFPQVLGGLRDDGTADHQGRRSTRSGWRTACRRHPLRRTDALLGLGFVREVMAPPCARGGRPSVDPELPLRMLLAGCLHGVRSGRRLCEEVDLNLAYRWLCRLGLDGRVPDHSTFTKNRHGRFRESGLMRELFERVVEQCFAAGLAGTDHVARGRGPHQGGCRQAALCEDGR